jgi:hypothetical protein
MKYSRLSLVAVAAVCGAALAGCDSTNPATQLLDDATVTNDVAASAGDAMAAHIEGMVGNETSGPFSGLMAGDGIPMSNATSTNRTTTCYDAAGAVVTNCLPIASVRRIVTSMTITGTRSRVDTINGAVRGFTGAVHRAMVDTVTRNFNGTTETSRSHTGSGTGNDTTTFTQGDVTRVATESSVDSVKAVTWAVPRSAHPISGSLVRVVSGKVTLTKGTRTETLNYSRTITVTFPPDANGNVTMTIGTKTCTLNLVTRKVGSCV